MGFSYNASDARNILWEEQSEAPQSLPHGSPCEREPFRAAPAGFASDQRGSGVMNGRRKIGYARVSTEEQTLALQLDALKEAGCSKTYRDVGVSGTALHRPGLDRCLAALRPGDVLVVWKFDRAFRSLKQALDMLEEFERRSVDFQELAHNIDTSSAMGRAFFQMRGAFAELESGINSERTIAGMEAARRRGVHIGRPPALTPAQVSLAHNLVRRGELSIKMAARKLGVHRQTLLRGFDREGLGSPEERAKEA